MTAGLLFSVIVPVYRDTARLNGLLAALCAQTGLAPGQFELVVIDNDPDGPDALAPLEGLPFAVRSVVCRMPGSYAARNAGAQVARGQVLAFTDADCRPEPGWLAALARAFADSPGTLQAGPVLLDPGAVPNSWAIFDTVRGIPQAAFIRRGYAATANLACPRAVFAQLGGFAPTRLSGGDAEFCRRAGRAGVGLRFVPEARIWHPARASWEALVTKARRIKGGQVAAGPWSRRAFWTVRSLVPPLREMLAYVQSPYSWAWRAIACRVRMQLWGAELVELVRLLILRTPPERR